jgi:DNA (cytosine-5)-methyltransferase 1
MLRSLELFGGVGGLALGLHAAGFDPVAVVENDDECKLALEANAKAPRAYTRDWPLESKNAAKVDYRQFGPVDLISAGAPCQPFSHGGQRKGDLDDRNQFSEVVRAIRELQPSVFLIENVRGLLFKDMEFYFRSLLRDLRTPSGGPGRGSGRPGRPCYEYVVKWSLLNAADFGLPQNRLRLFIVGLRPELGPSWRWPDTTHSRDALLKALLGDRYWDEHGVGRVIRQRARGLISKQTKDRLKKIEPGRERWRTLRDLLATLEPPARRVYGASDPWHFFVPDARLYPKHTGSSLDWPAKTVKAGVHGCPGGEHIVLLDRGNHRYLTVRECALLQGFPPDFAFSKIRTRAMRQIGNAVPVPVAAAVGSRLVEVLAR